MKYFKALIVSTLFVSVAAPNAFSMEVSIQERQLKRAKTDAKPRTCEEKTNYFFGGQKVPSYRGPELVQYMRELGVAERDLWKKWFPDIQFLIKGREDISSTILEAFYNAWTPSWDEKTSKERLEFVEDNERRQFSLAKSMSFFPSGPIAEEQIKLKAINYWLPSLKWQDIIEQFIDVGWFRLAKVSQNNCYWELLSVGTVGVHKLYWPSDR